MININDLNIYDEQDLIGAADFWSGLIDKLDLNKPDDVIPELRETLVATETYLEKPASASI